MSGREKGEQGSDRAATEGSGLRFVCLPEAGWDAGRAEELSRGSHATLEAARAACAGDGPIAVLSEGAPVNLDPYRPPHPIVAAGGYVVRRGEAGPEVLLIYRRGAWDLPKGKQDPGETPEETALREVREEVGIRDLALLGPLGATLHGYPEPKQGRYAVKTTHWFAMTTPERRFEPEEREGIERVEWVGWDEAVRRLGYDTLRRHAASVAETVARYAAVLPTAPA